MKDAHALPSRALIFGACLALLAATALAQPYELIELDDLGGNSGLSAFVDVTESGLALVQPGDPDWSDNMGGGLLDLETGRYVEVPSDMQVVAVNDAGLVVGTVGNDAAIWSVDSGLDLLPHPAVDLVDDTVTVLRSAPAAINAGGLIAGSVVVRTASGYNYHWPCIWTPEGAPVLAPNVVSDEAEGICTAVNDAGVVAGYLRPTGYQAKPTVDAFTWDTATGAIVPVAGIFRPSAINEAGDVIGLATEPPAPAVAVIAADGTTYRMDLFGTYQSPEQMGLNDAGQAVIGLKRRYDYVAPSRHVDTYRTYVWNWADGTGAYLAPEDRTDRFAGAITDDGLLAGWSAPPLGAEAATWWDTTTGDSSRFLPPGPLNATPVAINESRQVTGHAWTPEGYRRAFLWDEAGGMRDLGALAGYESAGLDINENGTVAGWSDRGVPEREEVGVLDLTTATVWKDGAILTPQTLPEGRSEAVALSNNGNVVVQATTGERNVLGLSPLLWNIVNGNEQELPFVPYDINESLDIAGLSFVNNGWQPVVWNARAGGTAQELGILPLDGRAFGLHINANGAVAGFDDYEPFLNGSDATLVQGENARLNGLNDAGEMVGTLYDPPEAELSPWMRRGVIWNADGEMTELTPLVDYDELHVLTEAHAINNRGDIVGVGLINGVFKAVLLAHKEYDLDAAVVGAGSVTPGPGSVRGGVTLRLEATPGEDAAFSHWEGDLTGSDNPAELLMDTDKTVTAVFVTSGVPSDGEDDDDEGENRVDPEPNGDPFGCTAEAAGSTPVGGGLDGIILAAGALALAMLAVGRRSRRRIG